jgi:hypothetical protein
MFITSDDPLLGIFISHNILRFYGTYIEHNDIMWMK